MVDLWTQAFPHNFKTQFFFRTDDWSSHLELPLIVQVEWIRSSMDRWSKTKSRIWCLVGGFRSCFIWCCIPKNCLCHFDSFFGPLSRMGLISNIPVDWARVLTVPSSPLGKGKRKQMQVCEHMWTNKEVPRVIPGPFAHQVWKSHPDPGLEWKNPLFVERTLRSPSFQRRFLGVCCGAGGARSFGDASGGSAALLSDLGRFVLLRQADGVSGVSWVWVFDGYGENPWSTTRSSVSLFNNGNIVGRVVPNISTKALVDEGWTWSLD